MFYCAYHGAYIDNKLINKDIGCASEYGDWEMARHICFIEKSGIVGTCPYPEPRCNYCSFKQLYEVKKNLNM